MSDYGPWSVKGIDGKAREVAKQTARLKGMTLGRYINELLLQGHSEAGPRELSGPSLNQPDTSALPGSKPGAGGLQQTTARALEKLDGSIHALNERLEAGEGEQKAFVRTTEALIRELTETQQALHGKIESLELRGEGESTVNALRELETALGMLASHVYEENGLAQDETTAIKGRVEEGFAELAERLDQVELKLSQPPANDVAGLAHQLEALEGVLDDMQSQIQQARRRSEADLDTLDRRMQTFYADLDAKLASAERRNQGAIRQISEQAATTIQRIQAQQDHCFSELDHKLQASDQKQRVRVTQVLESVSDRLSTMQEQAATVVSPVQKAIATLAARLELMEDRQDGKVSPPLGDVIPNIPAYETKLAAFDIDFLEEGPPSPVSDPLNLQAPVSEAEIPSSPADTLKSGRPSSASISAKGPTFGLLPPRTPELQDEGSSPLAGYSVGAHRFHLDDDRHETRDSDVFEDRLSHSVSDPKSGHDSLGSSEDYLEHARSAALRAANGHGSGAVPRRAGLFGRIDREVITPLAMLTPLRKWGAIVFALGLVLVLGSVAWNSPEQPGEAVYTLDGAPPVDSTTGPMRELPPLNSSDRVEAGMESYPLNTADKPRTDDSAGLDQVSGPVMDEVLTLEVAASQGDPIAQFQLGQKWLNLGQIETGVPMIEAAAATGLAAAEYKLAKLYEDGLGVPANLVEARFWTERAALGGNSMAMHDMAVFFAEGEGGPQSYAAAAEWFRRAADLGVVDSQYNLALLYENGLGLSSNILEGLYWFSVAAANGDPGAEQDALRLSALLGPELSNRVLQRVGLWRVGEKDAEAHGNFALQDWQISQRQQLEAVQTVLNGLGYPAGIADGIIGPTTRSAIISFQSDVGLPTDGQVSPELVAALNRAVHETP